MTPPQGALARLILLRVRSSAPSPTCTIVEVPSVLSCLPVVGSPQNETPANRRTTARVVFVPTHSHRRAMVVASDDARGCYVALGVCPQAALRGVCVCAVPHWDVPAFGGQVCRQHAANPAAVSNREGGAQAAKRRWGL